MPRCFVIQPFDKGPFVKRYDDVFEPAIKNAGLDPYRVDRDPAVVIPIDTIEEYIRESDICLADITLDNPNVWYEVGYSFANGKDVVLVCSDERKNRFPFDVRHRTIITYTTHSTRDFTKLGEDIELRLKAFSRRAKTINDVGYLRPTEGLEQHEIVTLILIMEGRITPDDGVIPFSIVGDMERAGYMKVAASLALEALRRKGLIELSLHSDRHEGEYQVYKVTEAGVSWCLQNQDKFTLVRPSPPGARVPSRRIPRTPHPDTEDDDIPF